MRYDDEYAANLPPGFDPEAASPAELGALFEGARCISRFHSAADGSFVKELQQARLGRSYSYRIDAGGLLEVNDSFLRTPVVIRNEVDDLISFQFVSSVKRAEFLGERKNVHDLGPAVIVSAIPRPEYTYRVPRTNETIRHVVVYTTLSNLMERMGECALDYPVWLREILELRHTAPRQRVLFLEDVHRELTWPFFHQPVSGHLLNHWMNAKFNELLTIGLQILKNDHAWLDTGQQDADVPRGDIIRRARTILDREYANPPSLPQLARHLGISGTQLKSGFKSMHGTTVGQYTIERRIEAARLLLNENSHSISEIADIVGYQDHSAFTRAFRRLSGCTPRAWRLSRRRV
ncbi:helix-turn-helix transcriptional regulator [Marinihelvus fidelis]|uniref:Helix-turn-helix transcriptional regulator n=1 Tax=Marinihelvus fidelis TaxID=2613842 RepID=A0A5N0TG20_9GAMM|nr:AraC family transcriptional regulator [Marinihelvus fidelis]KAA9134025.1 helix-turn-helix transcriptional regulator [Marinihelvus fidelis]